jgi:hypothetical protein
MKKYILSSLIVMLTVPGISWATRIWLPEEIRIGTGIYYNCGKTPSLVLLMGSQPVVSNYSTGTPVSLYRRTPIDWEVWNGGVSTGYIAGDGARTVISSSTGLVTYAPNETFYNVSSGRVPMSYQKGTWVTAGPQWNYEYGTTMVASADATGTVYMATGSKLARVDSSTTWSTAIDFSGGIGTTFGLRNVSDLAVSPWGEIALTGEDGGSNKMVIWWDYKQGTWARRLLSVNATSTGQRIGLAWDSKGNLGVAYSDNDHEVKFDYLNMETGSWSSDVVYSCSSYHYAFTGAALAFDRFNNPVIASGNYLIYDPVVPEPASIVLFGLAAVMVRRWRR